MAVKKLSEELSQAAQEHGWTPEEQMRLLLELVDDAQEYLRVEFHRKLAAAATAPAAPPPPWDVAAAADDNGLLPSGALEY